MSDTLRDKSFRLTWRDGAYYVSKPNIETQEVVSLADSLVALAARDAEWRAAVERVRVRATAPPTDNAIERAALGLVHSTLDALLAAMEVTHDGQ